MELGGQKPNQIGEIKVISGFLAFRMGRAVHKVGTSIEKALDPVLILLLGAKI